MIMMMAPDEGARDGSRAPCRCRRSAVTQTDSVAAGLAMVQTVALLLRG